MPELQGPLPLQLYKKLANIVATAGPVPATGFNEHHKYKYRKATDVLDAVRPLLIKHNVLIFPVQLSVTVRDSNHHIVQPDMIYRVTDLDSGEFQDIPWAGFGYDPLDKGLYKGITGGGKYFLISLFSLPFDESDDPEFAGKDDDGPIIGRGVRSEPKAGGTTSDRRLGTGPTPGPKPDAPSPNQSAKPPRRALYRQQLIELAGQKDGGDGKPVNLYSFAEQHKEHFTTARVYDMKDPDRIKLEDMLLALPGLKS